MNKNQINTLKIKIINKLKIARADYKTVGIALNKLNHVVVYKACLTEIRDIDKVIAKIEKTKTSVHAGDAAGLHEDLTGVTENYTSALILLGFAAGKQLNKLFEKVSAFQEDFQKMYSGYEGYEKEEERKLEVQIAKQQAVKDKAAALKLAKKSKIAKSEDYGLHSMVEGNRGEARS